MAHNNWCGKVCSECKTSCGLDESVSCSPDCENLNGDGTRQIQKCIEAKCDAFTEDEDSYLCSKKKKKCTICGQKCFEGKYPEIVFLDEKHCICEECSIDYEEVNGRVKLRKDL